MKTLRTASDRFYQQAETAISGSFSSSNREVSATSTMPASSTTSLSYWTVTRTSGNGWLWFSNPLEGVFIYQLY